MHSASLYRGIPFVCHLFLAPGCGGCALTFAEINLLVYLDFSNLICLNEIIKQPLLWPNLSQTGIVIIGYPSKQSSPKARLHQQQ